MGADDMKETRCQRSARLMDLAHDMFNRDELDYGTYRAICAGLPDPCDDRACDTCFRQPTRPKLRSV